MVKIIQGKRSISVTISPNIPITNTKSTIVSAMVKDKKIGKIMNLSKKYHNLLSVQDHRNPL